MGAINPIHVVFVVAIALLVLGPRRLPEAGRSLGRGMREFKQAIQGRDDDAAALPETTQADPARTP